MEFKSEGSRLSPVLIKAVNADLMVSILVCLDGMVRSNELLLWARI